MVAEVGLTAIKRWDRRFCLSNDRQGADGCRNSAVVSFDRDSSEWHNKLLRQHPLIPM